MKLPERFVEKMRRLLGPEAEAFFASYDRPRHYGLRVNGLKTEPEQWRAGSPFGGRLAPVPWAKGAYYYDGEDRPGKHPHYYAGLYYIQEPSAMAPAELLDPKPGDRVLDLCAAPGGKSTQIASLLQGQGVLVANDNAGERTKALAKNIERAGVRNAVITNEEPAALAARFAGWFDRVLVDAPCSGEGMFRKDESMVAEWEKHSVERYAVMQRDILRHAAAMLKPGGTLVYSTCTFSPEENEAQIAALLADDPKLEIVPVTHAYGWSPGRPEWVGMAAAGQDGIDADKLAGLADTVRLWPHRTEGEGHYVAVLRRRPEPDADGQGEAGERIAGREESGRDEAGREERIGRRSGRRAERNGGNSGYEAARPHAGFKNGGKTDKFSRRDGALYGRLRKDSTDGGRNGPASDPIACWMAFARDHLRGAERWEGRLVNYGSRVYLQPDGLPDLDGLKVVRAGWYLGDAARGRFEPSQALAMGLKAEEAVRTVAFDSSGTDIVRYLKGETIHLGADRAGSGGNGYALVLADGHPVGWGKIADGMLKNALPAGWRMI